MQYINLSYLNNLVADSLAAVTEELFARLFLMGAILYIFRNVKSRWYLAIVISSLYWSFLHLGPDLMWAKAIQVFPFGIALGWLMKKYGFETCVFMHFAANLLIVTTFSVF